ncbi:hypothetical protein AAV94_03010 [Lampropedia cohaerens]|uniref:Poly-beta-1,6-N-acetyl-D-glucosamine biosynthesis protein PgaD n=1 Tax=Lampropedia cohaerens TaxID=1610491 RepID=A0A0U1Q2C5_9BURK|nr:poly-beta-1,6-N-acetyl-D-glucosamine biosynthesis protein PgaD [Lampropedia cohaerens]KKW68903.1 hypothetical protein AAV94_03010 [Lampropedia cohaerens]
MTTGSYSQQSNAPVADDAASSELVWHPGQSPGLPAQPASALLLVSRKRSLRYVIESLLTGVLWLAFMGLCLLFLGRRSWRDVSSWREFMVDFSLSMLIIAALYLTVLAAGAIVLGIWAAFNKFHAMRRPAEQAALLVQERALMRSFEVSRTMLDRLHARNVATVFHDEEGEITAVRAGCHIPEEDDLAAQQSPESFYPTQWDTTWGEVVTPGDRVHQPIAPLA